MNYDKLVKQLRTENTLPYSALKLMREAADAIELSESLVSVYKDALCSCVQNKKQQAGGDCINRSDVLDFAREYYSQGMKEKAVPVMAIKNIPSPTVSIVSEKRGKWIAKKDGYGDTYYDCSCCRESFCLIEGTPTDNMYNFCPNCGARMDGE